MPNHSRIDSHASFIHVSSSLHNLVQSFIGILLIKQPFLILGIDDVELAKGNAFGAAGTFLFTFLLSIFFLLKEGRRLNITVVEGGRDRGRGHVNRFGDYSTVIVQEYHEDEAGTFT